MQGEYYLSQERYVVHCASATIARLLTSATLARSGLEHATLVLLSLIDDGDVLPSCREPIDFNEKAQQCV